MSFRRPDEPDLADEAGDVRRPIRAAAVESGVVSFPPTDPVQDAATTDLDIEVEVVDGVAYLRGTVCDLVDTDSALEVAGVCPAWSTSSTSSRSLPERGPARTERG